MKSARYTYVALLCWATSVAQQSHVSEDVRLGNLRFVGEYMNAVMLKIRGNQELQTLIEPSALLPLPEGDCQLQSGNIRGLCHLSHNRRLHLQRSHEEDPGSPLNVVATLLAKGVCFDAVYEYAALPLYLTGSLEGRLEVARMDLVIAAPANQNEQPTVKLFETKEFTGVNVSKLSAGLAFQKCIATTAIRAVKITIADVMTHKVAPILNHTLKEVPYPDFALE